MWCHLSAHATCLPRHRLRGSGAGSQGRGAGVTPNPQPCVYHWCCCRVDGKGAELEKLTRQTLTCPQTSSPTPTNRHQSHCSVDKGEQLKGFPPNWTMTICRRGVGERRVQPAQLLMPQTSSSTRCPPCPAGWPHCPAQGGCWFPQADGPLARAQQISHISSFYKLDALTSILHMLNSLVLDTLVTCPSHVTWASCSLIAPSLRGSQPLPSGDLLKYRSTSLLALTLQATVSRPNCLEPGSGQAGTALCPSILKSLTLVSPQPTHPASYSSPRNCSTSFWLPTLPRPPDPPKVPPRVVPHGRPPVRIRRNKVLWSVGLTICNIFY